jgi:hypothetical protein
MQGWYRLTHSTQVKSRNNQSLAQNTRLQVCYLATLEHFAYMSSSAYRAKPFPVAEAIPSYWRKSVGPIDNHRSTEDLPARADIVIIGAGYVGASIAHHLIEESVRCNRPIPSILILEAREACSGASGRNGTW